MKKGIFSLLIILLAAQLSWAGRLPIPNVSQEPYASALLLNADTGKTLFADNADARVYPASTLKMMVLLVILEKMEQGIINPSDMVQVTDEAYRMGGSQVYLDPSEQFSVEDLLYALIVQSANDAAVALATHVAGSKKEFVAQMNQKAQELGMLNTRFHSVHGLPPSTGQQVDITTARDFGLLSMELARHPAAFDYTSARVRDFRGGEFIMRTHNHLLEQVVGCDGFKTGYFTAAGFSIAATAIRDGVRVIAVVMGSKDRKVRDAKAIELLNKGFAMVPAKPQPVQIAGKAEYALTPASPPPPQQDTTTPPAVDKKTAPPSTEECGWSRFFMGVGVGFALFACVYFLALRKRTRRNTRYRRL